MLQQVTVFRPMNDLQEFQATEHTTDPGPEDKLLQRVLSLPSHLFMHIIQCLDTTMFSEPSLAELDAYLDRLSLHGGRNYDRADCELETMEDTGKNSCILL